MPKHTLKKLMPNEDKIRSGGAFKMLGEWLHEPYLWHLNRRTASRAVLVGLFCAFIPIPIQMFIAAFICVFARANLPLTIFFVWTTNPLTMAPVFYATYKLGALILDIPTHQFEFEMTWAWLEDKFNLIWKPLFLGSFIAGLAFSAVGYTFVDLAWRWNTARKWHKRKERNLRKRKKQSS